MGTDGSGNESYYFNYFGRRSRGHSEYRRYGALKKFALKRTLDTYRLVFTGA